MARRGRRSVVRVAGPRRRPREDLVFAAEQIEIALHDAAHLVRATGLVASLDAADADLLIAVAAQAELLIDSAAAGIREFSQTLVDRRASRPIPSSL